MSKMQADIYKAFGDPAKVVAPAEVDIPTPAEGEILIRMIKSPIHNHDLLTVRGEYGVKPELPMIGGTEAVGTVVDGAAGFDPGTRVAVADVSRTWANYFTAPAASVAAIPDGLTDDIAAQIMGMPRSAVLALDQFKTRKGDWLIVNAANGAVAKVIASVGRSRGLNVAQLVRNEKDVQSLRQLGFQHVFDTGTEGWLDQVRAAIGKARVAGGIDMVAGKAAGEMASLLSDHGLLLSFGAMSNEALQISPADLIFKQITLRGFWNHILFHQLSAPQVDAINQELFGLAAKGELALPVAGVFSIADGARAMAMAQGPHSGKVLISGES